MNNGTNSKRTNMDFSRLEETIERLHFANGKHNEGPAKAVENHIVQDAILYLEWLSEMLENRKLYHKKQNKKKQLALKTLQALMSKDELREIDRQADIAIGNIHAEPTFE